MIVTSENVDRFIARLKGEMPKNLTEWEESFTISRQDFAEGLRTGFSNIRKDPNELPAVFEIVEEPGAKLLEAHR